MGTRYHYDRSGRYKGYSTDTPTAPPGPVSNFLFALFMLFCFAGVGFMFTSDYWLGTDVSHLSDVQKIQLCRTNVKERNGDKLHYVGPGHIDDGVIYIKVDVDNFGPDKQDVPIFKDYATCKLIWGRISFSDTTHIRPTG